MEYCSDVIILLRTFVHLVAGLCSDISRGLLVIALVDGNNDDDQDN